MTSPDRLVFQDPWVVLTALSSLPRTPSWRSRWQTHPKDPEEISASTVTSTRRSRAAAATRWQWTSRPSAGTGSSPPNDTRPTTAPGSASLSSYRSTLTLTLCTKQTPGARRAPAAPPPRCPPSTCCTSTAKSRSSTGRSPPWWWTAAGAHETGIRLVASQTWKASPSYSETVKYVPQALSLQQATVT